MDDRLDRLCIRIRFLPGFAASAAADGDWCDRLKKVSFVIT